MHNISSSFLPLLENDSDFFYFFKHNESAMWVFDVATLAFLEVNESAVDLYGYPRNVFLNMNISDIRCREDVDALKHYVLSNANEKRKAGTWQHIKADGTTIWVDIVSFPVLYEGRKAKLVTARNITVVTEQDDKIRKINKELSEYKHAITSSSIVSVTNRQGIIEYVNDHFVTISGYSKEELIGQSHQLITSNIHKADFWSQMWNTVMKGGVWRSDVCNRRKDGSLYWVDSCIIPIRDEGGKVQRIISVRNDITEKKERELHVLRLNEEMQQMNEQLHASRQELVHLSLVATLTGNMVLFLNLKGRIEWVNPAFIHQYGYTQEDVSGKTPEILYGPLSSADVVSNIKMAFQRERSFKEEMVHYTKAGEKKWVLVDGRPVKDATGRVQQYLVVNTDITALKEKEAAVLQSEMQLNTIMNSTNSPHLFFDKNLQLQAFNKVAADFGRSKMGVTLRGGLRLEEIGGGAVKEKFVYYCTQALQGVNALNREVELVDQKLWLLVNYITARDSFGNILGVTFTALDITERKLAEEKIGLQNQLLKEIAWKQSHIVRAPVANILCILNLLKTEPCDAQLLQSLQAESEKLDGIIRDIVKQTTLLYSDEAG